MAYVLDLLLGDPPDWPHPIRWIGIWISRLEKMFYKDRENPTFQRLIGCAFFITVLAGVAFVTSVVLWLAFLLDSLIGQALAVWLAYTTLATRSLHVESRQVVEALEQRNLNLARDRLARIVSRDTESLDEKDILRAVLETVSENLSDGIVAPLFYLALGGPLGAILYKTVNTLDSMVGYLNDRYRHFGWCSARVDDLVNWIPARLSGWFLIGAAFCLKLNWENARQMMARDASKMKSPNAGFPEAAAAGALEIQLGGTNIYFGKPVEKPTLGDPHRPLTPAIYRSMIRLMYATSFLAFLVFLGIRFLISIL